MSFPGVVAKHNLKSVVQTVTVAIKSSVNQSSSQQTPTVAPSSTMASIPICTNCNARQCTLGHPYCSKTCANAAAAAHAAGQANGQVVQTNNGGGIPGGGMITNAVNKIKSLTSSSPSPGQYHTMSGPPPAGSWVQVPANAGPQQVMLVQTQPGSPMPPPPQMTATATFMTWASGPPAPSHCMLPGCGKPVWIDPSGKPSRYCSIAHKNAGDTCALPNCGKKVYKDPSTGQKSRYCGRTHAAMGAPQSGPVAPTQYGVPPNPSQNPGFCQYQGCTKPAWIDPTGKPTQFCGKTHMMLGQQANALAQYQPGGQPNSQPMQQPGVFNQTIWSNNSQPPNQNQGPPSGQPVYNQTVWSQSNPPNAPAQPPPYGQPTWPNNGQQAQPPPGGQYHPLPTPPAQGQPQPSQGYHPLPTPPAQSLPQNSQMFNQTIWPNSGGGGPGPAPYGQPTWSNTPTQGPSAQSGYALPQQYTPGDGGGGTGNYPVQQHVPSQHSPPPMSPQPNMQYAPQGQPNTFISPVIGNTQYGANGTPQWHSPPVQP